MALYSSPSPKSYAGKNDARSNISAGEAYLQPNRRNQVQVSYRDREQLVGGSHELPALHTDSDFIIMPIEDPPVSKSKSNPILRSEATGFGEKQNGLFWPFLTFYRAVSGMLGFKERYSLFFAFVCGGGLFGFCLARAFMMDGKTRRQQSPPGDYRWFDERLYGISYAFHVYTCIVGGIFVGLQFLPAIRRNFVLFHRLNGYFCIVLLIPGNIAGAIVARRSYGGEINQQAVWYLLTVMFTFSILMGLFNVKRNTQAHRKWMLRAVVYFAVVILAKVLSIISRAIITNIGGYYSVWRCDEVNYVLQNADALFQRFPQCNNTAVDISNNPFSVAVLASDSEGKLEHSSALRLVAGMCLWLSLMIHLVGVEIYLYRTEDQNSMRRGYVLESREGPEGDYGDGADAADRDMAGRY
ncbi:hypothetical protein D9758_004395 [Tetrapyrgos nigripes]|uniref:DUF2306 domain-containing protein n=1 Tax=Tetrapyrgos nigripes TaxID=182062 RepID=A0A8H5LSK0_9AGAR|nr:hypothetical protein D9758_004395 [Tetrapyrgos nigripes]